MDRVHFTLRGTAPLLLSNPRAMGMEGLPLLSQEEQAEIAAYRFPDGNLCFPAIGVRNAMLTGAVGETLAPKQAGRARGTRRLPAQPFVAGSILLADEYFPLMNEDREPLKDFVVDLRRVSVGKGIRQAFILRARARINPPWLLLCVFQYTRYLANIEPIRDVLFIAGQRVGIGGYRIEKKGPFGSFEVVETRVEEGA